MIKNKMHSPKVYGLVKLSPMLKMINIISKSLTLS